jgi:GNAT superfamily N-acetyltransferase
VPTIAPAEPADVHALADLMEELDRFYGVTAFDPLDVREEQIRRGLFGPQPLAYVLLAKDGDDLVGMAAYSFLWPAAGVSTSLFLKELYVRQDRQRTGVGRLLVAALCDVAVAAGCSRVEWQTDQDNLAAQGFYKALGVAVYPGKVFYRLDGDALYGLAASAE